MKHPYDDTEENRNSTACMAKSYSLPRPLIAAIHARAKVLALSDSAYVCAVIRADLVRGVNAPLSLEPAATIGTGQPPPRGVVVPGFDEED
jgi:hypothetical protein